MADSMYGYCAVGKFGLHERKAIGYEKLTEGGQTRYWVVWVCEICARTWWVEDPRPVQINAIGGPNTGRGVR